VSLQFQADVFNIFNRTNLAPVGFPATGEGGTISSTLGPYLGNPTIGPGEPLNVEFAPKVLFYTYSLNRERLNPKGLGRLLFV
jgi:hypothetical protein